MKSLFLAAAMLLTAIAMSQTGTVVDSGGDYDAQIRSTFQFVSIAGATTGKLIERAPRLINIEDYNGSRLADSLTMNFDKFIAMYIMGSAASYTGSSGLPNPDLVYNNRATINGAQVIYLLAQRYNQFDPAAAARGQITQIGNSLFALNNLFGNGLFASPNLYLEDTLFAAAIQDTVFRTGTMSFILPASAIVSNWGTAPLQNISIDWGDGLGSQPYNVGQTAQVNYLTSGTKKVILSYTQPNGKILKTQFSVQVSGGSSSVRRPETILGGYKEDATHHITIPVTALKSYFGLVNSVNVDVYFACDDQKIRKPLILLDGFEPMDHNSVTASDIITALTFSNTPTNNLLGDDFQKAGYDLIFVDWNREKNDQGRDYIQRNAYLLEAIIKKVNDMKSANVSSEQNIVIGFSMGGVIGKYALLDMEKDNPTAANGGHDARLFIAYDAPLKGANISLGTQHFLRHLSEYHIGFTSLRTFTKKLQTSFDVIHSPAATQMLIYQANDVNPYAPATHLNFQNELEHQGMNGDGALQKCIFKAISNGSVTGKQQFNAGDVMFFGHASLLQLADLNPFVSFYAQSYLNLNFFVAIDLDATVVINSLPVQGGVGVIYDGYIKSYTRVLNFRIPHEQHYYVPISDSRPLDTAPGGFTALAQSTLPSVFTAVNPLFCFIPAVSALEIKNQPILDNLNIPISDVSGVTTAGLTKVKSYEGSRGDGANDKAKSINNKDSGPDNQLHVSFSYRNTGFLLSELLTDTKLTVLPNGTLDNRTYNFGVNTSVYTAPAAGNLIYVNVSHTINSNLTIQNNGQLWVNRSGKINFTDQNNPVNTVNADYPLTVGGTFSGCTPTSGAIININNTGIMDIGQAGNPLNNTATVHIVQGGEIDVNQGGQLITENSSTIQVESGGVLNIKNGGFSCAMWGAKIVVKSGGVVHVFSGGTLRISEYSALILDGGQLILDAGATLQLWDGQAPGGQATVWVKTGGELVVNGNFTFSGNGFFQFDYGHKLTLNSDWALNGFDKAHRLIQLNSSTQVPAVITSLDISGHAFSLTNCLVTSDGTTQFLVHDAPSLTVTNVSFQGTRTTIGMSSNYVGVVAVNNCDFTGLKIGALITNALSNNSTVIGSHFSACIFGLSASNVSLGFTVANCLFDGYSNSDPNLYGNIAILISNSGSVWISQTTISGGNVLNLARAFTGVQVTEIRNLILVGVTIKNCMYGVNASNSSIINPGIILGQCSMISGCQTGITMHDGVFYMLGSALIGNGTGVYGNNIILNIDNFVQGKPGSDQAVNFFSNNFGSKLFDICYPNLADLAIIYARNNIWRWPTFGFCRSTPTPGLDWNLRYTSPGESCSSPGNSNIILDRSNETSLAHSSCNYGTTACFANGNPTSLASNPTIGTVASTLSARSKLVSKSLTSVMVDGVLRELSFQYDSAMSALRMQNLRLAAALFLPVASISDASRNAAPSQARQMIDVARIFSDQGTAAKQNNNWLEGTIISMENANSAMFAKLYPNPADQYFRIELSEGRHEIRAFNAVGALVRSVSADGSYEMDTRSWPSGMYTVEAVNTATHEKWRGKVMIQK